MCQNLFTGRIAQNIVKIIILFLFFPTLSSKYVYQLSEKIFLSVLDFLGLRNPHFQELKWFSCLLDYVFGTYSVWNSAQPYFWDKITRGITIAPKVGAILI